MLSAIGKAAGVGQGTLYRHFPDREALVWAVYEREVDELVAGAGELLASLPPRQALHDWMVHLARVALTKASLGAGMNQRIDGHTQAARPGYVRIATATATYCKRAATPAMCATTSPSRTSWIWSRACGKSVQALMLPGGTKGGRCAAVA